jgi:hypothetical protein
MSERCGRKNEDLRWVLICALTVRVCTDKPCERPENPSFQGSKILFRESLERFWNVQCITRQKRRVSCWMVMVFVLLAGVALAEITHQGFCLTMKAVDGAIGGLAFWDREKP